jgi:hypothetical protein
MMTRKFNLLLSLLGVLVTSSGAMAQTAARTVMVQSNNALLLYPTNFWSANAAQARAGLSLGSAATNPASAFQPSSLILSNLAAGQGLGVTNITGTLSVVSGGTGGTNATEARANLGLGSAATNPASAFQPSSTILSNLATGNGADLTNIAGTIAGSTFAISNVTGLQSALDTKLATNGNGAGLSSLSASAVSSGTLGVAFGGTGATNAAGARTSLGLGTAATSAVTAFQPSSIILSNLATGNGADLTNLTATVIGTNINISNVTGLQSVLDGKLATNGNASSLINFPALLLRTNGSGAGLTSLSASAISSGTLGVVYGGTGATNASGARIALGLGTTDDVVLGQLEITEDAGINVQTATGKANTRANLGLSWAGLTNTSAMAFRDALELGTTNDTTFNSVSVGSGSATNPAIKLGATNWGFWRATGPDRIFVSVNGTTSATFTSNSVAATTFSGNLSGGVSVGAGQSISFGGGANVAGTRTNLGLGAAWLTNTDAASFRTAIGLDSASTNPASAFQPASTILSNLATGNGADLTNITATISGTNIAISNVVGLQSALDGKLATNGSGATLTNLTASNIAGAVALINGGTGATNAAGARTNLGLGATFLTNSTTAAFRTGIGLGSSNDVSFNALTLGSSGGITFPGTSAGTTRTNLDLGWPALTNTNAATALLGVNTNGNVVYAGTNVLTFTNNIGFSSGRIEIGDGLGFWDGPNGDYTLFFQSDDPVILNASRWDDPGVRSALGLGATWLTNANVTNFRTAIGLGLPALTSADNESFLAALGIGPSYPGEFNELRVRDLGLGVWSLAVDDTEAGFAVPIIFAGSNSAANTAATRTNLGLGATWLTNTNVTNFRTAIGLGATNTVTFGNINAAQIVIAGTNIAETGIISGGGFYISDENTNNTATVFEFSGDAAERLRANARTNLGLGVFRESDIDRFAEIYSGTNLRIVVGDSIGFYEGISFIGTNASNYAANSRTSLRIPLPALTNTSNVTMMRALSGSTNTNHPFSGSISVTGTNNTNTLIFSNGILQSVTTP